MASSLFGASQPQSSLFSRINAIKGMIGGNPQGMYRQMMASNPQFAEFVRQNQGKTPQQIAQEHGIDFNEMMRAIS